MLQNEHSVSGGVKMKKLLIAAVMCLLVSLNVLAEEPERFTSGNCEYTILDEGTVELWHYTGANEEEFEVPEEVNGYKVTSIGKYAFGFPNILKSIKLPESINHIEGNSFMACKNISFLISPDHPYFAIIDGVLFTKPDKRLIYFPDTKENYVVPDGIQAIGNNAFFFCDGLISITLPDSVTNIGGMAFYSCENLSSITLPDSITSIGNGSFGGCVSLTSITLPDSVTSIEDYAFVGCNDLTITVSRDSYAATYCEEHDLSYTYPDSNDWLN